MAALTLRSRQVIRRRLRYFQKQHLVVAQRREFGDGPGARENVLSVTDNALELLRSKGKIKRKKGGFKGKAPEALFIEHELFVNWFFIHLLHIQRVKPRLKVQPLIISSKRYNTRRTNRKPMIARLSTNQKKSDRYTIIPDGIFTITDREQGRALLFLLEVDRGTEPLVNKSRTSGDIRHKVICYQRVFQMGRYKTLEDHFQTKLRGFRLLFVCNERNRMNGVCKLVGQMAPSDFIWVTWSDMMDSHGLSAKIWVKGGRIDKAPLSILGGLSFEASVVHAIQ
jgi:hypothetical protein